MRYDVDVGWVLHGAQRKDLEPGWRLRQSGKASWMRGHQIEALCFSEVIKGTFDLGFGVVGALGFGSSDLRKCGHGVVVRYQQACMQSRMSWSWFTGSFSLGPVTDSGPF